MHSNADLGWHCLQSVISSFGLLPIPAALVPVSCVPVRFGSQPPLSWPRPLLSRPLYFDRCRSCPGRFCLGPGAVPASDVTANTKSPAGRHIRNARMTPHHSGHARSFSKMAGVLTLDDSQQYQRKTYKKPYFQNLHVSK